MQIVKCDCLKNIYFSFSRNVFVFTCFNHCEAKNIAIALPWYTSSKPTVLVTLLSICWVIENEKSILFLIVVGLNTFAKQPTTSWYLCLAPFQRTPNEAPCDWENGNCFSLKYTAMIYLGLEMRWTLEMNVTLNTKSSVRCNGRIKDPIYCDRKTSCVSKYFIFDSTEY